MSAMTPFLKTIPLRQLAQGRTAVIYNVTRQYADLTLDELVPGPYPKTKKERLEAAKKYGLLPHEYEPFPDNGMGRGDYPLMPDISGDARSPHYPWDYPEHRRNFNEAWHAYSDLIHVDRSDISEKLPMPLWKMYVLHAAVVGGLFGLIILADDYKLGQPVMRKDFVANICEDGPHYTFEPAC